jgi:two-component sensor histidine kinase
MRASQHPRQPARLAALRALDILDTPRELRFDSIVMLAAELCDAPIAVINLIDEHRQWFKAEVGLGVRETPLETSICSHVILQPGLTIIPDMLADPRMCDNPLCLEAPNLRFYAGALLQTDDGLPLGTLCILDHRPRDLSELQKRALTVLADQVMVQMQLRRELQLSEELRQEVDHRVKNSLGLVGALLSLQAQQSTDAALTNALGLARNRIAAIASIHEQLHESGSATNVELSDFVNRLIVSLSSQTRNEVVIHSAVPAVMLKARDAVNVGIILNELVTNALRHGFTGGRSGRVTISGAINGDQLRLTVEDTGSGLPPSFNLV